MTERRSLKFSVFDVDGAVHEVTVEQEVNNTINLSAFCSCGQTADDDFCSHRFDILSGETEVLASPNIADLAVLKEWVRGSDIEVAMVELSRAKSALRLAMERVDQSRKKLARCMLD